MASHALVDWNPEDPSFWEAEGRAIANRNLWISIPSLSLAFAVWMLWSVVVVCLPSAGFAFTFTELFWLAAVPAASGATLRLVFAFMVPVPGGRRWTAVSTALLLVPTLGLGWAVQDTSTGYTTFAALALLCGLGGGNFASSMASIDFFFPEVQKGTALGLNAGLGNLGVALAQFVVPVAITAGVFGALGGEPQVWMRGSEQKQIWLQNAGFLWVPLIALCALAAWRWMDDPASGRDARIPKPPAYRHAWSFCWLYFGTFGSFIGYAAVFPLLAKNQFPLVNALSYAWLGPLMGALIRPLGGWLAEKFGAARITRWNFLTMVIGVAGVLHFLPHADSGGSFYGFLAMFMLLFLCSGIGNGSVFCLIPAALQEKARCAQAHGQAPAPRQSDAVAHRQTMTTFALCSAVGAYGGFAIPAACALSIAATGGVGTAFEAVLLFYLSCIALTWRDGLQGGRRA